MGQRSRLTHASLWTQNMLHKGLQTTPHTQRDSGRKPPMHMGAISFGLQPAFRLRAGGPLWFLLIPSRGIGTHILTFYEVPSASSAPALFFPGPPKRMPVSPSEQKHTAGLREANSGGTRIFFASGTPDTNHVWRSALLEFGTAHPTPRRSLP